MVELYLNTPRLRSDIPPIIDTLIGFVLRGCFYGILCFQIACGCVILVLFLQGLKKNSRLYKKDCPNSKRNAERISGALDKCDWSVLQPGTN